jgi:DNA-directed RNA polymerase specialized sigma24 family protein
MAELVERTRRLFTRYEHGNLPVDVHERSEGGRVRRRLTLHVPDGSRIEFGSQGGFLAHLYGSDNRIPFERYFRIDARPRIVLAGVDDVLAYCRPEGEVSARTRSVASPRRGIDLENRGIEVKRILFARFGAKIVAMGYDPHDVLQEVYRKLLVANHGAHPYDPSRASFGHYVFMVCDSALRNYRKKEERRARRISTGIAVFEENKRVVLDVGDVAESKHRAVSTGGLVQSPEAEMAEVMAVRSLCDRIGVGSKQQDLACRIVKAFHEGCTRRELSRRLEVSSKEIREALDLVRENATAWADDEGIVP